MLNQIVFSFMGILGSLNVADTINISEANGLRAIQKMTGCYLIDYSYHESESLKDGYAVDKRTYEVNIGKSNKEWIELVKKSEHEVRLQHVLFSTNEKGEVTSMLKHQAEDWEYQPTTIYSFETTGLWKFLNMDATEGQWTRKVTHLDDGPRYQCAAAWNFKEEHPSWTCKNFSPIPGRETRDMGRKDYQALDRETSVVLYGNSWVERQNNVKTILSNDQRIPLAKEVGKNWYVRLDDADCKEAKAWAEERHAFWTVLMNTWEKVYQNNRDIREIAGKSPPRYAKIFEAEDKYFEDLNNKKISAEFVQTELEKIIFSYIQ